MTSFNVFNFWDVQKTSLRVIRQYQSQLGKAYTRDWCRKKRDMAIHIRENIITSEQT